MNRGIPPGRPGDLEPNASGWGIAFFFAALGCSLFVFALYLLAQAAHWEIL